MKSFDSLNKAKNTKNKGIIGKYKSIFFFSYYLIFTRMRKFKPSILLSVFTKLRLYVISTGEKCYVFLLVKKKANIQGK